MLSSSLTLLINNRPAAILYHLGRFLLGVVFFWSGLSKAFSPELFADIISAYGLLPDALDFTAAIFLIISEIIVALGLWFDKKGALTSAVFLLLLFIGVLGYGIALGLDIDCGCFGPDDPEAQAFHDLRGALFRDLALLLVVVYLYLWRFGNRAKRT